MPVIVVTGLPRSGTSMMMKMLENGGIPLLTDGRREADEDNPKGYFEYEAVKGLKNGESSWLKKARGKAVKIISPLLMTLPEAYDYRIVFLTRALPEILASQRAMLIRSNQDPDRVSDTEMTRVFEKHLEQVFEWMDKKKRLLSVKVHYSDLMKSPSQGIRRVNALFGGCLNEKKMSRGIDPALYRQKAG